MFINKIKIKNDRARPLRVGVEGRLARYRLVDSFKSGAVGLLLLSVVVSVILGSEMALFATMLVAWALFPVLVGLRNVLDAGCAFMLISVGVLVVVGLAQHGHGYLLP
jgi:hypothetical protein